MSRWKRWFQSHSDGVRPINGVDSLRTTFQWTYDPVPQSTFVRHAGEAASNERSTEPRLKPAPPRRPLALSTHSSEAPAESRHLLGDGEHLASSFGAVTVHCQSGGAGILSRLDEATAAWRNGRVLPSSGLLREGLMVLEAGEALPAAHRTLLLHTALYRRRGVLTALRHQDDSERTGLVVAEALTTIGVQLPIDLVRFMAERDPNAPAWRLTLLAELRGVAAGLDRERAVLASQAYRALTSDSASETTTVQDVPAVERHDAHRTARYAMRKVFWLGALVCAICLGIGAVAFHSQRTEMVDVRAGEFVLPGDGVSGALGGLTVERFSIDRFETTNREYRRCYERGQCDWPSDSHLEAASNRIENYFVDPVYDMHPVVNVSQEAAEAYCHWVGKRLPTEAEWHAAAAAAPATGRLHTYPWGEQFDRSRANTFESGRGAPAAVGSHRPAGDSPSGAADMAGNVAEWTSAIGEDGVTAVVKGGSFKDLGEAAKASASILIPRGEPAGWIGFRCARD